MENKIKIKSGLYTDYKNYELVDIKNIETLCKKQKNKYLVISGDELHKIYIDIDCKPESNEYNKYYDMIYDELILGFFDEKFNISIADSSSKKYNKVSFRVIINEIKMSIFDMKFYIKWLRDTQIDPKFTDFIDLMPYYSAGAIRLPYCSKDGQDRPLNIIKGKFNDFLTCLCDKVEIIDNNIISEIKSIYNENETIKINNSNIKYFFTKDQVKSLLDKLPEKYYEEYQEWLYIVSILKSVNLPELLHEFSKKSKKYSKSETDKYYKLNKGIFNINFLVHLVNKETKSNVPLFDLVKLYNPLENDINCDILKYENKYVFDLDYKGDQLDQKIFDKYSTVIIKSTTGTGKTTATAKFCADEKYNDKKILSIITRVSLVNQHIDSFNKEGIELIDYRTKGDLLNKDLVICINSLMMISKLSNNDLKNYIVYIDEISSFLETLTHNNNLDANLKIINNTLMRIVKNAYKVIVSDALISDNVFNFLNNRDNKIYVENTFKKYKNIPTYEIKKEDDFLMKLNTKCINNDYFLAAFDSNEKATQFYNDCLGNNLDKKDKFILLTADTKIEFNNASEYFKDKFVFYSPSITFGVDFSIDVAQDVFVYIKGRSILPSGSFQQTTRTRNIKNLYFYVNQDCKKPKYNNINDVKDYYKKYITESQQLLNLCAYYDEDDNLKIIQNTYFDLYCYNEYVKDCYETNKYQHYKIILKENNFNIIDDSDDKNIKISKELNKKLNDSILDEDQKLLEKYIKDDDKNKPIYSNINYFKTQFKIDDNNKLKDYVDIIFDKYKINDVLNVNRFYKDDKYINEKIKIINNSTYDIKTINNVYYKIKYMKNILNKNNLGEFDIDNIKNFKMSIDEYSLGKKLFNSTLKQPKNDEDYKTLIVHYYKNLFGEDIIKSKRQTIDKKRKQFIH